MNKEEYDSLTDKLGSILAKDLRSKRRKLEFYECAYILTAVEEKFKNDAE